MTVETDEKILKIVSATIKRHSMDYQLWQYTKFWSDLDNQVQKQILCKCNLQLQEMPILAVFINESTWTLFSTRAVYFASGGMEAQVSLKEIEKVQLGDFKGYSSPLEFMNIQLKDGVVYRVIYETGKPSLGPIYAIQTLQQVCSES